jgi:hypothetical protein
MFHRDQIERNSCSDMKEGFLFGGLSPPNEKIPSRRPRRLCGEILILAKNGEGMALNLNEGERRKELW